MSATLASLRIRNLALVEDLTWEPGPGFLAVTGETGAGKSIILGALNLLLGERGDRTLVRSGAEACTVEAVLDDADRPAVAALLADHGTEACEDGRLILKRTLPADGAGRQFVNGSPCTLALFRQLGDLLVDLHGPHDHQSLFSRDQQTRLLDRFGGTEELCAEVAAARRTLLRLREERSAALTNAQAVAREIDLLTHQVGEIETAAPAEGEEEALVARQKAAANFQRVAEWSARLMQGLSEDERSLVAQLADHVKLARELARLDPAAEPVHAAAEAAFSSLEDAARAVQSHAAAIESGPGDLDDIESRLDLLQTLKRKYGSTVAEVMAFHAEASARLEALRGGVERADHLDADIAEAERALAKVGGQLSTRRGKAARALADRVREGLTALGFAKAGFSVPLEAHDECTAHGFETAEFQFSPNPGEPARPLRAIASSGEISRVMLAIKGALAAQDDIPILVFDEIDANVGGEVAAMVGRKMSELARDRQVLCITHLPQVAAAAARQFIVRKEIRDKRTRTLLDEAAGDSRVEEIARMLGGKSASALAHARTLLKA